MEECTRSWADADQEQRLASSHIPTDNRRLEVFETYREDVGWEVYATCKVYPLFYRHVRFYRL